MVCFDAKISFDDNAQFRQREIFSQEDTSESDPREVEATQHGLNYISMDGNIGCLGEPCSQVFLPLVFIICRSKTKGGEGLKTRAGLDAR